MVNERERYGSVNNYIRVEMRDFANFIHYIYLIDVQCKGKSYSWYISDGKSMSRIDRFLLSDSLICDWGIVGQLINKRDLFDHCPIWLIIYKQD